MLPPAIVSSSESFPSVITNVGLHVRLYLTPAPAPPAIPNPVEREFEATLDCVYRAGTGSEDWHQIWSPAIRILALGGDQYARVWSDELHILPSVQPYAVPALDEGHRYIYVRQNPTGTTPIIRIGMQQLGDAVSDADSGFSEIYPESRWDDRLGTFTPQSSRLGSVVAGFRYFFSTRDLSIEVDVFVGIDRGEDGASWTFWCTQQRVEPEVSLQENFWVMEQLVAETLGEQFSWGCEQGGITASLHIIPQETPILGLRVSWTPRLLVHTPGPVRVIPALSDFFGLGEFPSAVPLTGSEMRN